MMQSKLLVFFRKDKGECCTLQYGTLSAYFFRCKKGASFRHLSNTRYETAQGCIFSCFTFFVGDVALPDWWV